MPWIPSSNSKTRHWLWGIALGVLLSSGRVWGGEPTGWTRPLFLREIAPHPGYAALPGADGQLYVFSAQPGAGGDRLELWRAQGDGVELVAPVAVASGTLTGLALAWRGDHWHLAWGVEGQGVYYARVSSVGKVSQPRLVWATSRPLGAPLLSAHAGGLYLLWNSMCQGTHAVYLLESPGEGRFSGVPRRLSPPGTVARVSGVAYLDEVLYVSWREVEEYWTNLVVLPHQVRGESTAEPRPVATCWSRTCYGVDLTAWPEAGVLLSWTAGEGTRGEFARNWPVVSLWAGSTAAWSPLRIGPGQASAVIGPRTAVRGEGPALLVWNNVERGRLVAWVARLTADGTTTVLERLILDDREFLRPHPYVLADGRAAVLLSLRTGAATTALYLVTEGSGAVPWWYRWGIDPRNPWGDVGFKLFMGLTAGLLAALLALPAVLLGLGVVMLLERAVSPGGPLKGWRQPVMYGVIWLCRGPNSWLYAETIPAFYPAAYLTAVISAVLVGFFSHWWAWPEGERLQLMARGTLFVIVDGWLLLLAGIGA